MVQKTPAFINELHRILLKVFPKIGKNLYVAYLKLLIIPVPRDAEVTVQSNWEREGKKKPPMRRLLGYSNNCDV